MRSKLKLVVCSDLHLDAVTMGIARHEEIASSLEEVALTAIGLQDEDMKVVFLCMGDITDPDSGSSVFRVMRTVITIALMLDDQGVENHWIAGNHDVFEDGSGETTLMPLGALSKHHPLIHVHEKPYRHLLNQETNLVLLPYTASSHPYDPKDLVTRLLDPKRKNIVAGHLMIPGITPGEETNAMARGRDVSFPIAEARAGSVLMLNGHYHGTQIFEGVHIPGSLARLTAGEERNDPCYFVLDV